MFESANKSDLCRWARENQKRFGSAFVTELRILRTMAPLCKTYGGAPIFENSADWAEFYNVIWVKGNIWVNPDTDEQMSPMKWGHSIDDDGLVWAVTGYV